MRYVRATRKPRADWWDDDCPMIPTLSVGDHVEVDTGLLWSDGEPIMRAPNPIGFGRGGEW